MLRYQVFIVLTLYNQQIDKIKTYFYYLLLFFRLLAPAKDTQSYIPVF